MTIEARLGRLPYTAEDAAARRGALELAGPADKNLPGRMTIDKNGAVRLAMEIGPLKAAGMASLLKEVTGHILKSAGRLKQLRGLLVD